MKKQFNCFGCGKALTIPKVELKNLVKFLKGSCSPTWIKLAFKEDEESYYFLCCPTCTKLILGDKNANKR